MQLRPVHARLSRRVASAPSPVAALVPRYRTARIAVEGQRIAVGRASKCLDDIRMGFRGSKGIAGGNVCEASAFRRRRQLDWIVLVPALEPSRDFSKEDAMA